MKYSINVNDVKRNEGSLKDFATVTFGESFKVTNIAILQSGDGRMFVSMPRYKTNQQLMLMGLKKSQIRLYLKLIM